MATDCIELRGVRVHNLQNIDVDIPLRKLTVIVGVSGSGKSSLAFDTLYAEGQRRYIDSFSAYARQFLDRLARPDADRIDRIPPAIAIKQSASSGQHSGRSTVATDTEVYDYLRLLYAKIGKVICSHCETQVTRDSPSTVIGMINGLADDGQASNGEPDDEEQSVSLSAQIESIKEDGFSRAIVNGITVNLTDYEVQDVDAKVTVVVDRLVAGQSTLERLTDSLETAFQFGEGRAIVLVAGEGVDTEFNDRFVCSTCARQYLEPEHRLFSFNSPLGACPDCSGTGQQETITFQRVVPDPGKTIREGAIACWTTPAYRHELDELLDLAPSYNLPVDVPFSELTDEHRSLIFNGVPARDFGGLKGFLAWLQRKRYKIGVGVFLSRWRSYVPCAACHGARLGVAARSVRIDGLNIGEFAGGRIDTAFERLQSIAESLDETEREVSRIVFEEILTRLQYLGDVGLGYITLDRRVRSLSGGERQRVSLTSALGSSLVNTLYVLDEPSAGLHPSDSDRVIQAIERLRLSGNTVVVVEHEEEFLKRADHVIEIGPAAGRAGGTVVFDGTPAQMMVDPDSVTGNWVKSRDTYSAKKRSKPSGFISLKGVQHHNLKNVTVDIPLGVLCVVTGVSGSGKSSLVHETFFPAACVETGQTHSVETAGRYSEITGCDQISGVVMVDQHPVGRTARSNPVTYLKAFDEIRKVFALTAESKLRNFTPSTFSFNSKNGGRCPKCEGSGSIKIDMQFLADLSMECPECGGRRYRAEVLEAKYRGLSIWDVLEMTVDDAFTYFRGHAKLQKRLQVLRNVGLGYLPLGQPATTLSGGESQRLKLAAYMRSQAAGGSLFLLDEPTNGLHGLDVATLLKSLDALVAIGHTLVVIEHHMDVICHADYIIDLGPGPGEHGGTVVATGTPEEIAEVDQSATGRLIRQRSE
ncbi:UNVERIFIED_CONTAM: hypothetical protein GTU68_049187 [Idotea baltica]|nr:hypothetical protein [Idotea baltica]